MRSRRRRRRGGAEWGGGVPRPQPTRGLGQHRKLPQRGSGGAPAEIDFGEILRLKTVFYLTDVDRSTVSFTTKTPSKLQLLHLYNKRRYVCLSVCLYLCSVWPAKRLGRSTPNLAHTLMPTQGVFLSRSMSRSFMCACGGDGSTKHPECATWRTLRELRLEDERLCNLCHYNCIEAGRGAAGAEQRARVVLRPEDG